MKKSKGNLSLFQRWRSRALIIILFAGILFQALWYYQFWSMLVWDINLIKSDFLSIYSAGIVAKSYGLMNTYDISLQQLIQSNIVGPDFVTGNVLLFIHPPYLLPFLMVLPGDNFPLSYILWSIFLLILVGISMFFIMRALTTIGFSNHYALLMGVVGLLYYPIFKSIFKGQDTAFLLLGVSIWLYALLNQKDGIAGLGLALSTIRPQIGFMLAVPFLFNRRRVWWGFCLGSAILFLYSVLLIGTEGTWDLINIFLLSAKGESYGLNQYFMFNLLGLLLRQFPTIDPSLAKGLSWGAFLFATVSLSYLWKKAGNDFPISYLGLAVIVSLFFSPHLHFHDLSIMMIPATTLAISLHREKAIKEIWGIYIVFLTSLIFVLVEGLLSSWLLSVSYFLMFCLALGALLIKSPSRDFIPEC